MHSVVPALLFATFVQFAIAQEPKAPAAVEPGALASATGGQPRPRAHVTLTLRHEPADAACFTDPKAACTSASHWIVEATRAGGDEQKARRFTVEQVAELEKEMRAATAAAKEARKPGHEEIEVEVGMVVPAAAPFGVVRAVHDVLAKADLHRLHVVVMRLGKRPVERCLYIEIPPRRVAEAEAEPPGLDLSVPVSVTRDAEGGTRFRMGRNDVGGDAAGAAKLLEFVKAAKNDLDRLGHPDTEFLVTGDNGVRWASVVALIDVGRSAGFERIQFGPVAEKK